VKLRCRACHSQQAGPAQQHAQKNRKNYCLEASLEDDLLPAACLILALVVLRDSDRAINATIRPTTNVTYYEFCTKTKKVHLLI
jgi:hypothetical protein